MERDEDIIEYDFQGWPIYKMNLKELLLALGGKDDGDSISFDIHSPLMGVYPMVYIDDGMGYYVDDSYIVWAGVSEDDKSIRLQRARVAASQHLDWKDCI